MKHERLRAKLNMLPSTLTTLFTTLLALFPSDFNFWPSERQSADRSLRFELRHLHAVSPSAHVLFHDVVPSDRRLSAGLASESYALNTRSVRTYRPISHAAFLRAQTRSLWFRESEPLEWQEVDVIGPDVESRETLLELAKMTNNAYLEFNETGWYDLSEKWNVVS